MGKKENKKIGLALGGGSALGLAHLGVLDALEENGIEISHISGTSVGAIIGTLYAFGVTTDQIETEALKIDFKEFVRVLRPSKFGIISNKPLENLIRKYIGFSKLEDATIPLSVVATDISSGEKIVIESGDATKAILASSCIPGVFPVVNIGGKMLADGGIVENVPIAPLKNIDDIDIIIAVNLLRHRKYTSPKSVIGVLSNSFDMINHRISAQPRQSDAKILIEPNLSDFNMADFTAAKRMREIGRQETIKFISRIKEGQKQSDIPLFIKKLLSLFFPEKNL